MTPSTAISRSVHAISATMSRATRTTSSGVRDAHDTRESHAFRGMADPDQLRSARFP